MDRKDIILNRIDKNGLGLEIGPSHNPLASKRDGYKVEIIDHLNREDLVKHYSESQHHVNTDLIEEVDYVWSGESYAELTGKTKYYDWIISSHNIEHTPDLISFLIGCDEVLKDDGVLVLAVPDKRFCFDHFRPLTGLGQLVDAHERDKNFHSPGMVAEFCLSAVSQGGEKGWTPSAEGEFELVHASEVAIERMQKVIESDKYFDIHAW